MTSRDFWRTQAADRKRTRQAQPMKTDSLFYRLLQTEPTLAFELAGLAVPEPGRYGFISQEIKQTAFRLDGIAEPPRRPARRA